MASLIEELITVLKNEETEYKKILELSKNKTKVIVSGNVEALREMIAEEQGYLDNVLAFEKKRQQVINDIAIVLNKDVKTLNIKEVISLLKGQKEEQNKLSKTRDGLRRILDDLQRINDMNKNLIKESLEMTEFNINVIKGMNQLPETANYSRNASSIHNMSYFPPKGKFDAKQ